MGPGAGNKNSTFSLKKDGGHELHFAPFFGG